MSVSAEVENMIGSITHVAISSHLQPCLSCVSVENDESADGNKMAVLPQRTLLFESSVPLIADNSEQVIKTRHACTHPFTCVCEEGGRGERFVFAFRMCACACMLACVNAYERVSVCVTVIVKPKEDASLVQECVASSIA